MATIDKPQLRIDADITGPNPQATLTVTSTETVKPHVVVIRYSGFVPR